MRYRNKGVRKAGNSVGTFQAKTQLSQLVERVARGEEITITKHDRPVARLVPANRPTRANVAGIFQRMAQLRKSLPSSKGKTSLKDVVNDGRRF